MSKQREAFEAWVKAQDNGATGYEIWQASRAAALEETAALIESYESFDRPVGFTELAFAIRSKKEI